MRRMSRCCYTKAAACWRISAPKFRNLVAEWSDARLLSHLTCTLDAARYPSRIVPRLCTSTAGSCSGHDVQSCGDIALHSHSIFIHSFTCRTGQTCGESAATTIRRYDDDDDDNEDAIPSPRIPDISRRSQTTHHSRVALFHGCSGGTG